MSRAETHEPRRSRSTETGATATAAAHDDDCCLTDKAVQSASLGARDELAEKRTGKSTGSGGEREGGHREEVT